MKKSDKWYDKFMYVLASRLEPWRKYLTIKQIRYEMATAESGVKSQELQYWIQVGKYIVISINAVDMILTFWPRKIYKSIFAFRHLFLSDKDQ
jgi:hypothetical protein